MPITMYVLTEHQPYWKQLILLNITLKTRNFGLQSMLGISLTFASEIKSWIGHEF